MHRHASRRNAGIAAAALAGLALAACDGGPVSTASPDGAAPRLLAFQGTADSAVVVGPDAANQPAISGARIAYSGVRGGNHDIYVYDMNAGLETRVSSNTGIQQFPSISGNWVVYQDIGNSWEVRAHNLSTGANFQISPAGYADMEPSVSGTRVVYTSTRSTTGNTIYMYDLAKNSEVPLRTFPAGTSPMPSALEPEIGGDLVVWREQSGSPRVEAIMVHDLSTGTTRTAATSPATLSNPSTDGARVVYEDHRHGNYEIYMFDPATSMATRITTHSGEQRNPRISGNVIVWEDHRHGNAEIYAYDLSAGTEHRVTWNSANQLRPAISGSRIVWQDGRSYTDTDIYMRVLAGS